MIADGTLEAADPLAWVNAYLLEQRRPSAVERFATAFDAGRVSAEAGYYRDLIPSARPADGSQYAFEVDLDRCTGCKACVTGCHSRNGLDEGETWRSVGLLHGGSAAGATLQTVTTACHHCVEPGCLQGCPVLAYEKDPTTGIVRHLDDQCIGCRYCEMKCPYDVPKYSASRGIVRKCDMCTDRLAHGEAPACVQSCPNEAIRIVVVERDEARERAAANFAAIGGAPDPSFTVPSTIYRSQRPPVANLRPLDEHHVAPQHGHLPLVLMLVATQASTGVLFADVAGGCLAAAPPAGLSVAAAVLAVSGLGVALLHLGRPRYALRAILGLRTSWLSRELLVFGAFLPMVLCYSAARLAAPPTAVASALGWATVAVGLAGILCSAMIYIDTPRPFWATRRTAIRFLLTACAAAAGGWSAMSTFDEVRGHAAGAAIFFAVAMAIKLWVELAVLTHRNDSRMTPLRATATLLAGPLRAVGIARVGLLIGGVVGFAAAAVVAPLRPEMLPGAVVAVGFAGFLAGELCERFLFFAAVAPPRMPGGAVA